MIALALAIQVTSSAFADGADEGSRSHPLKKFQQLILDEKYQKAITGLDKMLKDVPDDADILNLLAYSHRRLEHFDIALNYYHKALKIKPKHRGANEYLGELYLRLGQLDKAEKRLAVLDKACFFGCDEFDDLEQAIAKYREQNPS